VCHEGFIEKCGVYITDGVGKYPNNQHCGRRVSAPHTDDTITLSFTTFDFDFGDYLWVFDGPDERARTIMLATSGTKPPTIITSSSQHLYLKFVSDGRWVREGFNATVNCVTARLENKTECVEYSNLHNVKEHRCRFIEDDPCIPDPCKGHGTCNASSLNAQNLPTHCYDCHHGYEGPLCERCIKGFTGYPNCRDPCVPSPCDGHWSRANGSSVGGSGGRANDSNSSNASRDSAGGSGHIAGYRFVHHGVCEAGVGGCLCNASYGGDSCNRCDTPQFYAAPHYPSCVGVCDCHNLGGAFAYHDPTNGTGAEFYRVLVNGSNATRFGGLLLNSTQLPFYALAHCLGHANTSNASNASELEARYLCHSLPDAVNASHEHHSHSFNSSNRSNSSLANATVALPPQYLRVTGSCATQDDGVWVRTLDLNGRGHWVLNQFHLYLGTTATNTQGSTRMQWMIDSNTDTKYYFAWHVDNKRMTPPLGNSTWRQFCSGAWTWRTVAISNTSCFNCTANTTNVTETDNGIDLSRALGYWYGDYYPHGTQQVNVSAQHYSNGTVRLVATKLTGDENVPAGKVSWVTTNGVHAAIQLAGKGFSNPWWTSARVALLTASRLTLHVDSTNGTLIFWRPGSAQG